MEQVFRYIDEHREEFIERLKTLLRQPSVAAQNLGMEPCVKLVQQMLEGVGFKTQIFPTDGFPVVYGELEGQSDKTLMFYDHYDVQPPEPLELWESDPWDPQIRDGKLYARGSSDNKGDLTARLCALEAYLKTMVNLPVTVKFVV
jgi:acetylornithine deacetylase/succinyl-diaminopimelate desuccinylase-like protein